MTRDRSTVYDACSSTARPAKSKSTKRKSDSLPVITGNAVEINNFIEEFNGLAA